MAWSVRDKTVLVTGATSGIGHATAVGLARAGAGVIIGARNADRAERARADIRAETGVEVETVIFDLSRLASVAAAADEIASGFSGVHVIVNNAGVLIAGRRRTTVDGFELTFAVNHVGPFLLTTRLMPTLMASAPARVVNVSSAGYAIARDGLQWDDLQSEHSWSGWHAYGASKLCNLYFTIELDRRFGASGITANACHPGFVDTALGRVRDEDRLPRASGGRAPAGPSSTAAPGSSVPDLSGLGTPLGPEDGARTPLHLAMAEGIDSAGGRYFVDCEPVDPGEVAQDRAAAARLWEVSQQLVDEALARDV